MSASQIDEFDRRMRRIDKARGMQLNLFQIERGGTHMSAEP